MSQNDLANMDTTDSMQQALSSQEARLQKHDQLLGNLMDNSTSLTGQVSKLSAQLSALTAQLSALTATPPPCLPQVSVPPVATAYSSTSSREPHVVDPEPYSGDPNKCKSFLLQCSLVFGQKYLTYASDEARVQYVVGLLRGRALDWAAALWERSPVFFKSYSLFEDKFKGVFDHSIQPQEAANQFLSLKQGSRSVADYSIEFRVLAAGSGWNDSALRSAFSQGLS